MGKRLEVRLVGGDAALGRVPASDVAHLILGVESAIARAAAGIAGREPGLSGRRGKAVEAASRLRLVAIEAGSVVPVLELPDVPEEPGLGLADFRLGELALVDTVAVLTGELESGDVAKALVDLGDVLHLGATYDRVEFRSTLAHDGRPAILNRSACRRLRHVIDRMAADEHGGVVGTLVEADFERNTARLRVGRRKVNVAFGPALADDIHQALRQQASLQGRVTVDRQSGNATAVELRAIVRPLQRSLDEVHREDFWRERTLTEILTEENLQLLTSPAAVFDPSLSADEADAFVAALTYEP